MTVFTDFLLKGKAMQRFLVKQGVCAAICITIALSVCTYTSAATISEANISIAAEMSTRTADVFRAEAGESFSSFTAAAKSVFGTALKQFRLVNSEIMQAVVPEP